MRNPRFSSGLFLAGAAAVIATTVAAGCASIDARLPPVTDQNTGTHIPGKIIWHDLITDDPAAAKRFYGGLFGWEFQDIGLGGSAKYTLIRHNGRPIGGMVDEKLLRREVDVSQWITVMSVENVDQAVAAVEADGGTVFTPPRDLTDRGRIAVVADAQGAILAFLRSEVGDPPDQPPGIGDFLWDELWTSDVDGALKFFSGLTGLEQGRRTLDNGSVYRYLTSKDMPRAGVLKNPVDGLEPLWVNYIRVEDPQAITDKVPGLGGTVLLEPQGNPIGGQVALIADPSGVGVAIQTWTPPAS